MNWQTLKLGKTLSQPTLKKRDQQIAYIRVFLAKNGLDLENPETYKSLSIELIHKFLGDRAASTKIGYIDVLEVLTIYYGGSSELVRQLIDLRAELNEHYRINGSSKKAVDIDDSFTEKMEELKISGDKTMKILGDISLSEFAGARLADLINTRVDEDDGKHSYLDMETGSWTIRTELKKGQDRTILVPKELMEKLRTYNYQDGWLLTNKAGIPYDTVTSISNKFKRTYGMTYGGIRKGSCNKVHEKDDIKATIEHANILGHSVATELSKYVEKPTIRIKIHRKRADSEYSVEEIPYEPPRYVKDKGGWELSI